MSDQRERDKLSVEDRSWLADYIRENTAKLLSFARGIWFRNNLKAFDYSKEDLLSELFLSITPGNLKLMREVDGAAYLIMLNRSRDLIRSRLRIKRGGNVTTSSLADSENQEARLPLSAPPNLQEDLREALTGSRHAHDMEGILRDMRTKNLITRGQKALMKVHRASENQPDERLISLATDYTMELLHFYLESEKGGAVQEEVFRETLGEVVEDHLEEESLGTDFQVICGRLLLATIARIDQKYNEQERTGFSSQIGRVALQATGAHQKMLDLLGACRQLREEHPMEAMAVHLKEQGFSLEEIGRKMGLDQGRARRMLETGQKMVAAKLGISLKKRTRRPNQTDQAPKATKEAQ